MAYPSPRLMDDVPIGMRAREDAYPNVPQPAFPFVERAYNQARNDPLGAAASYTRGAVRQVPEFFADAADAAVKQNTLGMINPGLRGRTDAWLKDSIIGPDNTAFDTMGNVLGAAPLAPVVGATRYGMRNLMRPGPSLADSSRRLNLPKHVPKQPKEHAGVPQPDIGFDFNPLAPRFKDEFTGTGTLPPAQPIQPPLLEWPPHGSGIVAPRMESAPQRHVRETPPQPLHKDDHMNVAEHNLWHEGVLPSRYRTEGFAGMRQQLREKGYSLPAEPPYDPIHDLNVGPGWDALGYPPPLTPDQIKQYPIRPRVTGKDIPRSYTGMLDPKLHTEVAHNRNHMMNTMMWEAEDRQALLDRLMNPLPPNTPQQGLSLVKPPPKGQ